MIGRDRTQSAPDTVPPTDQAAEASWIGVWFDCSLSVIALFIVTMAVLWAMGALSQERYSIFMPLAWSASVLATLLGLLSRRVVARPGQSPLGVAVLDRRVAEQPGAAHR